MDNTSNKPTFKDSLKSWDTENQLDRYFYRPIGFKIAMLLRNTGITPNMVTIISIFFGVGGCLMFYPHNLVYTLVGFSLLVFANILDCVDGQLARITGIKSEIGRILDGVSGDLWFLTFYVVMTVRLIEFEGWGLWTIGIVVLSSLSHLYQASMVDYYKTLHLHFLKGGINSEFGSSESIKENVKKLTWKKSFDKKIFLRLYYLYTKQQELNAANLNKYVGNLNSKYPNGYPADIIANFRKKSLRIMPMLDLLTFNSRSILMLIAVLSNAVWIYFAVEILIFNPLLLIAMSRHERMCKTLNQ